jgi:hypothetical protein
MPDPDMLSLVDALVAALDAADFAVEADYAWQPEPWVKLPDAILATAQVWVIDFAETQDTMPQINVPVDEHVLLLVVQRKIAADERLATVVRSMAGLVGEICRYCRTAAHVDEASCIKVERKLARDFDNLHLDGLVRAEVLTTWRRMGS